MLRIRPEAALTDLVDLADLTDLTDCKLFLLAGTFDSSGTRDLVCYSFLEALRQCGVSVVSVAVVSSGCRLMLEVLQHVAPIFEKFPNFIICKKLSEVRGAGPRPQCQKKYLVANTN